MTFKAPDISDSEERIRKLMDKPIQIQILKAWAAIAQVINSININTHVGGHRCVTKVSPKGCKDARRLEKRYYDDFMAYEKIIGEIETAYLNKEKYGP